MAVSWKNTELMVILVLFSTFSQNWPHLAENMSNIKVGMSTDRSDEDKPCPRVTLSSAVPTLLHGPHRLFNSGPNNTVKWPCFTGILVWGQ